MAQKALSVSSDSTSPSEKERELLRWHDPYNHWAKSADQFVRNKAAGYTHKEALDEAIHGKMGPSPSELEKRDGSQIISVKGCRWGIFIQMVIQKV